MVIFTFRSDNWREIAIVLKQLRDLATRKHKFLLQLDQSIATHTHTELLLFYGKISNVQYAQNVHNLDLQCYAQHLAAN